MTDVTVQSARCRRNWKSDIHLGAPGYKAEDLLELLRDSESDHLYLVSDIVDGWQLRCSRSWVQSHSEAVQKLLRKAGKVTKVIHIPGYHDKALRDYADARFGGVTVLCQAMHDAAAGERLPVVHGDQSDGIAE